MRLRRSWRPRRTPTWGRPQLLGVLAAAVVAVLELCAGLVYAVVTAIGGPAGNAAAGGAGAGLADARSAEGPATRSGEQQRRDALAAAPMVHLPAEAARPQPLSMDVPDTMSLPAATGVDELGVATGFAATPEGAVAQLAAIDRAAFTGDGSLEQTRSVIRQWAAPGGPTDQTWSGVKAMSMLLSSANLSSSGGAQVAFDPSLGQVKATDGPTWVVACVGGTLTVTIARTARAATSDCQRMVWTGGRWVIGPGAEPAASPSAWPGSQPAIDAGWLELRDA